MIQSIKKYAPLALVGFAIAACGDNSSSSSSKKDAATTTTEKKKTSDTDAPTLTSVMLANSSTSGSTKIELGDTIKLQFNEKIANPGSVFRLAFTNEAVSVYKGSMIGADTLATVMLEDDGGPSGAVLAFTANGVVSDKTLTITLGKKGTGTAGTEIAASSTAPVYLGSVIKDAAGNASKAGNTSIMATGDFGLVPKPKGIETTQTASATGAYAATKTITVQFSEAVQLIDWEAGHATKGKAETFFAIDNSGDLDNSTIAMHSSDKTKVVITLTGGSLGVDSGDKLTPKANKIKSLSGVSASNTAGSTTSFIIPDKKQPTIETVSTTNGGGNAGKWETNDTVVLTFSEEMDATAIGTAFNAVGSTGSGNTITIYKGNTNESDIIATLTLNKDPSSAKSTANSSTGVWSGTNNATVLTITFKSVTGGTIASGINAVKAKIGAAAVDKAGNSQSTQTTGADASGTFF